MATKRHKPEEIVTKLRQVKVHVGLGMARVDAIREVPITEQTYYRWRKQYSGMGTDQLRELNRLQKENERLSKAVSDLTLDKMILTEAARGNFWAPPVVVPVSTLSAKNWVCRNVGLAGCCVSIARRSTSYRGAGPMKTGLLPTWSRWPASMAAMAIAGSRCR
ncbi:hypothetical protein DEA8626_02336 [Defluviimonas aquaemixtae]|uniref:Transposase n=1 Tax=Albidovulum aquaemixtae TaxID=1542388 RepID=A0A2R8B842_9RHOB|nr:hypothetical protein DEA8626_02336 [Defluviimonas aquaemixtae]